MAHTRTHTHARSLSLWTSAASLVSPAVGTLARHDGSKAMGMRAPFSPPDFAVRPEGNRALFAAPEAQRPGDGCGAHHRRW